MVEVLNNKKALISGEMVMIIPKIIFLIAVMFAFVILIKVLIITNIDIRVTEASILVNRILLTQDGFSYYDESIERLHPGIIDLAKFQGISQSNPNKLDSTVMRYGDDKDGNPNNPIIAAKIILEQEGKNDIVAFYNKERYDRWEPRVLPGIKGGGGSFRLFKKSRYVLVEDGTGVLSPAVLNFLIIT